MSVRYPFADLTALCRTSTLNGLAVELGVHRRQVSRWRADGMTEQAADRMAVRLGLHPLEVWPSFLDGVEVPADDDEADADAARHLTTRRRRQAAVRRYRARRAAARLRASMTGPLSGRGNQ